MPSKNESTYFNFTFPEFELSNKSNVIVKRDGVLFDAVQQRYFGILIYPLFIVSAYIILGLLGNSFVLYIFGVKWRRNKTSVFIITLASLDIINCSINMPIEIAVLSKPMSFDYDLFCKVARCFSYITTASYSFVLVAVAFDRYLMVCQPLKRMTLGKRYATRTCFGAVLLGVITQFPSAFIYGTFVFRVPIPMENTKWSNGSQIVVEGKTCLVTNYYYHEHPTLTYAFQGFLFAGHVVIFTALTVMYIIIGRRLFISSEIDLLNEGTSSNIWKKSIVSAITGSVFCGKKSLSTEHLHHNRNSRASTNSELETPGKSLSQFNIPQADRNKNHKAGKTNKKYKTDGSQSLGNIYLHSLSPLSSTEIDIRQSYLSKGNRNMHLNGNKSKGGDSLEEIELKNMDTDNSKVNQSPPKFKVGVRSLSLPQRSISMDGATFISARLDKPRSNELKEICLKRNTLIMRMVTFTFMLSYLPFLILVTLRYSHPEIPGSLSRNSLIVYHVFLRSYFFNSVIRPFIYAVMNEDFRHGVMDIFRNVIKR